MHEVSELRVRDTCYKGSTEKPRVGDTVELDEGERMMVARLGGVSSMFINCTFDDEFVLTHPEYVRLISRGM